MDASHQLPIFHFPKVAPYGGHTDAEGSAQFTHLCGLPFIEVSEEMLLSLFG
jgi:hypothetical protein